MGKERREMGGRDKVHERTNEEEGKGFPLTQNKQIDTDPHQTDKSTTENGKVNS